MKSKFLIYALIFTALLVVFQHINSKQIIDRYESDIQTLKSKLQHLQSKNTALEAQIPKDKKH